MVSRHFGWGILYLHCWPWINPQAHREVGCTTHVAFFSLESRWLAWCPGAPTYCKELAGSRPKESTDIKREAVDSRPSPSSVTKCPSMVSRIACGWSLSTWDSSRVSFDPMILPILRMIRWLYVPCTSGELRGVFSCWDSGITQMQCLPLCPVGCVLLTWPGPAGVPLAVQLAAQS